MLIKHPMIKSAHSTINYRSDIDGIRAIAVLSVIFFHAFPTYLGGGFVGVDIFFFISGFLISSIIFSLLEQNKFTFTHFYTSRIKRIFPALILVLGVCFLFAWLSLLPAEFKMLGKHIIGGLCFIDNILLGREAGYFDISSELKPLLHLWSLSIEEQFYLIFPVLIWCCWRFFSKRCLTILLCITCLSFMVNIRNISSNAVAAFFFPQARIWELLCGSIFAHMTMFHREQIATHLSQSSIYEFFSKHFKYPLTVFFQNIISAMGLLLLITSVVIIRKDYFFPGFWPLLPLAGTALIVASGPQAWCNRYILAHPVMVWIGIISYPLYLWHWPILSFIRITHSHEPSVINIWAALVLSVIMAWLTYILLEIPVRFGRNSRMKPVVLLVLGAMLVCLGYTMYFNISYPRSAHLHPLSEDIISSMTEWEFPAGLTSFTVDNKTVAYRIGSERNVTLFFGDSNIQQYSPRVVEIFKTKKMTDRGAIFLTAEGCAPFHWKKRADKPNCDHFVDALVKLAKDDRIDTIVVGASWFSYLRTDIFKDLNNQVQLAPNEDPASIHSNLSKLFKSIARPRREIYLLLNIPNGHQLDPSSFIHRDLFHIRANKTPIVPLNKVKFIEEHQEAYSLLKNISDQQKLIVIDPLNFLCKNDQCFGLDSIGKAKYKDATHLRPRYVRNHILYLDKTLG